MKKAILWDLDGTLLYTLPDIAAASNVTLKAFGLPTRRLEEFYAFVGNGARHQIRSAIGYEPENFEEICAYYKSYYASHSNDSSRPYDGVIDVTRKLQAAGWMQGIVTNKPDPATRPLWQAYFPHFELALGEAAGIPRKPAADMVLRALDILGVSRENAVYIGDSEVDIATAQAAGIPCISVLWGYRSEQSLREAGARWLCGKPEEIPERLEEILHGK